MACELTTEDIILDPAMPDRKVTVGSDSSFDIKSALISFLKESASQFAWTHFDMTGISTDVITHKLNIDQKFKPIQQKRRKIAPDWKEIVEAEVQKLLDMKMIREVMYPTWLKSKDHRRDNNKTHNNNYNLVFSFP